MSGSSEPRWTPGPWEYHADTRIVTADEGHTLICDEVERPDGPVIASAPAMYDALAYVAEQLDYLQSLWGGEGVTRTIADRVKAVMAQARGGTD